MALDIHQLVISMCLNFILELGQLFVATHTIEEASHFEGLSPVNELHFSHTVVWLVLLLEFF